MSDPRFRGKVVLVTLGGTWCPNCHDEAKFLAPFYREYRERGFEIIALIFERHGEFEKAARSPRLPSGSEHRVSAADRRALRD